MKRFMARTAAGAIALSLLLGLLSGCAAARPSAPESANAPQERPAEPRNVSEDLLLLVDFQNVYMPGQEWACPSMPEAIKNTIRILDAENAPDAVMTKFIAPADPVGRWAMYNEAYREINENEFLSEFPPELEPYARRITVAEKSTYSSMSAEEVLSAMEGKKAVVMAGVVADCCILATMYDAMDLGYEVVYLYDCIAGVSEESEAEIRALAEIFSPIHTTVMSSDEYLAAIAGG